MRVRNTDFETFARITKKENRKIVIWGTGTFFRTCIPYLLRDYGLTDYICCLVDKDEKKWTDHVEMDGKLFSVNPPAVLSEWTGEKYHVLITSSYFAGIVDWLRTMESPPGDCFVAPFMFQPEEGSFREYQCKEQQIPKVIHYCWFGRTELSEKSRKCIESWRKWCPDYEIVQWNEENYDVKKNRYMAQAYELGKYGYVPDYARIDLLYRYGGIYFDTDVELIHGIDDLLYLKGFTSFEEYPMVNFGGGSGSVKGLEILQKILEFREHFDFVKPDGTLNLLTCGFYETIPLLERNLKAANQIQNVEGLTVLTSDYFHVKSTVTKEIRLKRNTLGIHDFSWSWVSEAQKAEQRRTRELVEQYFRL